MKDDKSPPLLGDGWREVPGYGGKYLVNRGGDVVALKRISSTKDSRGFARVNLHDGDTCVSHSLQELVFAAFGLKAPETVHVSGSGLDEQKVREIRESSDTHAVVAERYGVSRDHVRAIRSRRYWKHVE